MSPSKNLNKEQNEDVVANRSSKSKESNRDRVQENLRKDSRYSARIRREEEIAIGIEQEFEGKSSILGEGIEQELIWMNLVNGVFVPNGYDGWQIVLVPTSEL